MTAGIDFWQPAADHRRINRGVRMGKALTELKKS
jgi:hypothetical protein